jgi:ribosomal-protein-alanine N-acetyltransferase
MSEELSAEASVFIVAESDETLAGFAVARLYPPNLELLDIAVAAQRQGVGRALIEALKSEAAGCDRITLEVSAKNEAGLAFYKAVGFVVVGRRPNFYTDADAVLMDLPLS